MNNPPLGHSGWGLYQYTVCRRQEDPLSLPTCHRVNDNSINFTDLSIYSKNIESNLTNLATNYRSVHAVTMNSVELLFIRSSIHFRFLKKPLSFNKLYLYCILFWFPTFPRILLNVGIHWLKLNKVTFENLAKWISIKKQKNKQQSGAKMNTGCNLCSWRHGFVTVQYCCHNGAFKI